MVTGEKNQQEIFDSLKISHHIFEKLLQLPGVPPETGGIIGQRDEAIDHMVIDKNKFFYSNGIYIPNVCFLNQCIKEWADEGIQFAGIFHTHALNWPELSLDDRKYMKQIMSAMPDEVEKLYFPIVIPKYSVKVFSCSRKRKQIDIIENDIEII